MGEHSPNMPNLKDVTHADFELNNEVVERVLKTLEKMSSPFAARWLNNKVSELGLPIIVSNTSSTFHRILKYWRTATVINPGIRDRGSLVYRAFKNGDPSQVFLISDDEAYNPGAHAEAAARASRSLSLASPPDRPMAVEDMPATPIPPGRPTLPRSPASPPDPISGEPTVKLEETPAAPIVDVSYSATVEIAGDTQVIPFTVADKDDVIQSVEDYVEYCRRGNNINYDTFAGVRNFMVDKRGEWA